MRYGHLSYGKYLLAVVAFAALAAGVFGGGSVEAQSRPSQDDPYDSEELRFLEIINEYRADNGLGTLILSDALTVASERHDEDMARYNFFAHETLGSSYFPVGSAPWDRMALSGYDYPDAYMAENLAAGYETAEEAFEAWRTSPGHNVNMLDGNQRVIGVARINDPDSYYGWYWTTDFGSELDPTSHAPDEAPSDQASPPRDERESGTGAVEREDARAEEGLRRLPQGGERPGRGNRRRKRGEQLDEERRRLGAEDRRRGQGADKEGYGAARRLRRGAG